MLVMDSSQSIAESCTVCTKEGTRQKRNSVNLHVPLVKSWVSITRTVISQSTIRWFEWPKSFHSGIRLLTGKETLVQSTATHQQLCDIRRVDLIVFPSICWKTLKRKQSISSQILMILKWNQQFCLHDFQTFFSTVRMVLRLVWQLASLRTTSLKLLGQSAFTFNASSKRVRKPQVCQVCRLKSTWSTSKDPTSLQERKFTVLTVSLICTVQVKDASMSVPDVMSSMIQQESVLLFMKFPIRSRNPTC